jgi:3-hydroxyisobutyrate dehydrogenase-like beta-hydroxyacid dehydrogenase
MPRVGVLGLGRMGAPIAARLRERFEVVAADPVVAPEGSVAGVDVLVTVLPGPPEVRAALLETLPQLEPGAVWLDLSSNDPRVVDGVVAVAAERGVASAAAPMSGGPAEAAAGTLRFFVAAPDAVRDLVGQVLDPLGSPFDPFVGERPSQAHLVKLLANGLWFGQVVAVTEALLLGRAHGLDPETLRALLAQSAGGSVFLERHAPRLLAGDDMTDFALARVAEELDALQALAASAGTPHALQALVAGVHREALAEYGPVDGELLAARFLGLR